MSNIDNKTIIRSAHNRENPFAQISKSIFRDKRLGMKERGILGTLLAQPDNWQVSVGWLVRNSDDGKASVRSGIKKLIGFGYMELNRLRGEKGHYTGTEILVHEIPIIPAQQNPYSTVFHPRTDFRYVENRYTDNRTTTNTVATTNKETTTNNHVIVAQVTDFSTTSDKIYQSPTLEEVAAEPVNLSVNPVILKSQITETSMEVEKLTLTYLLALIHTQGWKVSKGILKSYVAQHGISSVHDKINITIKAKPRTPEPFLREALMKDYQAATPKQPEAPSEPLRHPKTHEELKAEWVKLTEVQKWGNANYVLQRHPYFGTHIDYDNILKPDYHESNAFRQLIDALKYNFCL